jgi:hypothetical protein
MDYFLYNTYPKVSAPKNISLTNNSIFLLNQKNEYLKTEIFSYIKTEIFIKILKNEYLVTYKKFLKLKFKNQHMINIEEYKNEDSNG